MTIVGGIIAAVLSLWVAAPLIWGAVAAGVTRGDCASCGVRLEPDARFCASCGATVLS